MRLRMKPDKNLEGGKHGFNQHRQTTAITAIVAKWTSASGCREHSSVSKCHLVFRHINWKESLRGSFAESLISFSSSTFRLCHGSLWGLLSSRRAWTEVTHACIRGALCIIISDAQLPISHPASLRRCRGCDQWRFQVSMRFIRSSFLPCRCQLSELHSQIPEEPRAGASTGLNHSPHPRKKKRKQLYCVQG